MSKEVEPERLLILPYEMSAKALLNAAKDSKIPVATVGPTLKQILRALYDNGFALCEVSGEKHRDFLTYHWYSTKRYPAVTFKDGIEKMIKEIKELKNASNIEKDESKEIDPGSKGGDDQSKPTGSDDQGEGDKPSPRLDDQPGSPVGSLP